jgi:ElaA protein
MVIWKWALFAELSPAELYDICALRQQVFVLEQQCLYPDLDYHDQVANHLMGFQDKKMVAYLRILPKDIPYKDAVSFGRVLTAKSVRGQGIGKNLVEQALYFLEKNKNTYPIIISAQLYLEQLYQSFGFESVGEPYDEDNIPHIKMIIHAKK